MKRLTRFALLFSLIILFCTACAKEEPNEHLQTEHVPGTEEAVVHTATPSPAPTRAALSPTAVPPEEISPLPEPLPEEPAFMDMYRAMATGTRVNVEGVSEEEIRHCFCNLKLSDQTRIAFAGQAGLDWQSVRSLDGIRVLYYRNDGKLYICDVIADTTESENIMRCFYIMYQGGQKSDDLTVFLPEALSSRGYSADAVLTGNVQYLYIYK